MSVSWSNVKTFFHQTRTYINLGRTPDIVDGCIPMTVKLSPSTNSTKNDVRPEQGYLTVTPSHAHIHIWLCKEVGNNQPKNRSTERIWVWIVINFSKHPFTKPELLFTLITPLNSVNGCVPMTVELSPSTDMNKNDRRPQQGYLSITTSNAVNICTVVSAENIRTINQNQMHREPMTVFT